jgi:hypothetical protein
MHRRQQGITFVSDFTIEYKCIQPIIAGRTVRFSEDVSARNAIENLQISIRERAFGGNNTLEPIHLGAPKSGIDVGHPIIVANFIVIKCPRMRNLCRSR